MKSRIIKLFIFAIVIFVLAILLYDKFFVIENNIEIVKSKKEKQTQKNNDQEFIKKEINNKLMSRSLVEQLSILKKCIKLKDVDNLKLHKDIISVVNEMYERGEYNSICINVDAAIIIYCDSENLFNTVIKSFMQYKNIKDAVQLCDKIIEDKNSTQKLKNISTQEFKNLTIKKIDIYISSKDYDNAFNAFNILNSRFKGDTEVLVIGSEILLKTGDWSGAEYLLKEIKIEGQYKEEINKVKEKIKILKDIDKHQKQRTNINTVPYTADGNSICVNAMVNNYMEQKFILDTGASMTSIPPDSLENLGVHVPFDAPIKKVKTAGGIIFAREIEIKSINLNGFEVKNIKVLDLQLPDEPTKGLLGMNFLKYFKVEINHSEKLLILSEKND